MENKALSEYLNLITKAINDTSLVKLIVSKPRSKSQEIKKITAKLINIKSGIHLSYMTHTATQTSTQNLTIEEAFEHLQQWLTQQFLNSELTTTHFRYQYISNKKNHAKVIKHELETPKEVSLQHNREKSRLIDPARPYFHSLGITRSRGIVRKEMYGKFRQINRFIEIIDGLKISGEKSQKFKVYDMGSGKGYLSFALFDYLTDKLGFLVDFTGVELRKDLVDKCNKIAEEADYGTLHFEEGFIGSAPTDTMDMLIALHACDTATDDAILQGIKANAGYIILSPCCHKQIRPQIDPQGAVGLITDHGIQKERIAELATDTIRGLVLEYFGYKVKIMEYVSSEHTAKNIMIAAVKESDQMNQHKRDAINALKAELGIKEHYLEKIFKAQIS